MTRERTRDTEAGRLEQLARVRTGSAQMDAVLGGGFPSNSVNIIMGQPGTGKTILAEQLLFHNASGDRPSLYATTLSEPLAKVVAYAQRFSFFDSDKLATEIIYEDLGPDLADTGPDALVDWLSDAIKSRGPKIVVIDSFRALHDLGMPVEQVRRFVSRFAGLLGSYDVTSFLLGEYVTDDIRRYPEFAVADSIIEMARQSFNTRDERYLRILKLRGSGYREGRHAFRISNAGIELFPRLVAPRVPEKYVMQTERISTGVPGLDRLMDGGLFGGSTTLVIGMTGAGKTTIALQFVLDGMKHGEQVMYINFQENPAQLRRAVTNLGVDADTLAQQGLHLLYASPVELQIDSIVDEIFRAISERKISRLVIDAVGDLAAAANDAQRLHDYLYSLIQHFAARGVTTMLTLESGEGLTSASSITEQRFSYMSDNLLHLTWSTDRGSRRMIRIVKMRGSAHEHAMREFEIGAKGASLT